MVNVLNKLKPNAKLGAESLRVGLTNSSPMLIILCFICSLVLLGIIKYHYQLALFNVVSPSVSFWVAILFAGVIQVGRMAFGFVGVRDLVRGRWVIGILGIIASILITIFEHTEVNRMVAHWDQEHLRFPLLFLVWIALVFELRLIMTMTGTGDAEKDYQEQLKEAQEAEERRWEAERQQIEKQIRLQFEIREKERDLERQKQFLAEQQQTFEKQAKEWRQWMESQLLIPKPVKKKPKGNEQLNGIPT